MSWTTCQILAIWAVAQQQAPSLRVLASDKGQGGETVSDVTLPEDQTPFFPLWCGLCERQRGAIALIGSSSWTHIRLRPRLTPCCASADAVPAASPWGGTWNRLQVFGYRNSFGNKSAEGHRRFCCDYVLDIHVADDWNSGIFCKPEYIKKKKKSCFLLGPSFFFILIALFRMMVLGRCRSFVLLDSDGGTNPPIWGDTTLKCSESDDDTERAEA